MRNRNTKIRLLLKSMRSILVLNALLLMIAFAVNARETNLLCGADQPDTYLPLLKGQRTGLVINHTSTVRGELLVDFLKGKGITIQALFTPEHGLRGDADAGEKVGNSVDTKTGIPIISIYGKNNKPTLQSIMSFS